jgi:hypothetical protein
MLKISWFGELLASSVGFFTRALGRSETQQVN